MNEGAELVCTLASTPLAEGFVFGDGVRWHENRVWFSDLHGNRIMTADVAGNLAVIAETDHPSGLGWLPDGTLVFGTFGAPYLKRLETTGDVSVIHDFGPDASSLNDLVVGPGGRIYLDLYDDGYGEARRGHVVLVTPGGAQQVTEDLMTPNGIGITPDQTTLIVSETYACRLLAYPIMADGTLGDRRIFADLATPLRPDGLCIDEEGAVWVGTVDASEFLRVLDGGVVTHRIPTPGRWAVAPALGGNDRRTLYLLTAETTYPDLARGQSKGYIEQTRVEIPGAGWP
jgi:sugar lactone lactonase YvrE